MTVAMTVDQRRSRNIGSRNIGSRNIGSRNIGMRDDLC
jgi:hypothetical protein